MNFINKRQFKPNDNEIFNLRKSRFLFNLKIVTFFFAFGCATIIAFVIFSPLTESQKQMTFKEDQLYLFWLMYGYTTISTVISSFLAMTGSFFLFSLINFVSLEFKVLGKSFRNVLNGIEDEINDEQATKMLLELKSHVQYYQQLLM
jgi:7tm Odorant receptor